VSDKKILRASKTSKTKIDEASGRQLAWIPPMSRTRKERKTDDCRGKKKEDAKQSKAERVKQSRASGKKEVV
jgi:hypothetical protein